MQEKNSVSGVVGVIVAGWEKYIEKYNPGPIRKIKPSGNSAVVAWECGLVIGFTDENELLILNGQGGDGNHERIKNYFDSEKRKM